MLLKTQNGLRANEILHAGGTHFLTNGTRNLAHFRQTVCIYTSGTLPWTIFCRKVPKSSRIAGERSTNRAPADAVWCVWSDPQTALRAECFANDVAFPLDGSQLGARGASSEHAHAICWFVVHFNLIVLLPLPSLSPPAP